ncbi:hypothetical protein AAFF_G00046150 [Aldrovandia affinis]|uniref:Transposase element L1Md-A101/L1Md-A102/L1Md-A2 n=1 Tax=Aldrovandia affinis TaxID=143900 RepID=A0AAD7S1T5_9TELE|nr:hypothetical protein AAFF_G00046150 [Aldrovandia affinis]
MTSRSTKGRQLSTSIAKPSSPTTSSASSETAVSGAEAPAGAHAEDFKRELLSSLRDDFVSMMRTEVREVLEREMAVVRRDIRAIRSAFEDFKSTANTELATLRNTMGDAERSLTACSDDIETLKREVKRLGVLADSLQNKCEDLESRSRRNNIRIVGVPEGPNSCSTTSVADLLQEAFNLADAPLIDRSHRSLQPVPKQGQRPRTIVARLHYYKDCATILSQAKEKQRIKVKGVTISVYPDYTAQVAKARAAFNGVRQQLRGLEGVRFGIAHPARLRITYNGTEKSFLNPEEAQAYVTQTITPHAARTDRQMPS